MYEVEVKVAAEHDAVLGRLPDDAEPLGIVEQVDTYFDAPHRDFAETDEALRLRRERRLEDPERTASDDGATVATDWTAELAYKGPLVEAASKTREEFETVVADGEELESALERLGFEPAAEVRKRRERFRIDEYTVSLDTVEGLGEFLEVETEVDADDGTDAIEDPRDGALALLEELGSDPDAQIRTSYLGLLLRAED